MSVSQEAIIVKATTVTAAVACKIRTLFILVSRRLAAEHSFLNLLNRFRCSSCLYGSLIKSVPHIGGYTTNKKRDSSTNLF